MYSYTHDPTTGGLLLNSTPTNFSKEPRPVWAPELDTLGFERYWDYDRQSEVPLLWAESNAYWYRGVQLATLRGGDLYTAPELRPQLDAEGNVPFGRAQGGKLLPMDPEAMCAANAELLDVIEGSTLRRIVREYEKFRGKLDLFHVAYSGGKDSAVMLDLVKRALPQKSFVVIFGDTGMEFPDTYVAVAQEKARCEEAGIPFYIARSHFDPVDSWQLFGPPSKKLRWCCSVHKSTPQTLKMREITGKNDYSGLDFVGVRSHESLMRSRYEYENLGRKQKGQRSYYPLLEWTSAEVWLYIFKNHLPINQAYVKGNARAGCLLCPMASGNSGYIRRINYRESVDSFIDIIRRMNSWDSDDEEKLHSYVTSGGWINRISGRNIKDNRQKYKEHKENHSIIIEIADPRGYWKEWIKVCDLTALPMKVEEGNQNEVTFILSEKDVSTHPSEAKYLRVALKKAAYCVGCRVCETNCKGGHIHFENGKLTIQDCIRCHECCDIPSGCHAYNSLKIPEGEKTMKVINCFDDYAPLDDWLISFFALQDKFFEEHTLGPNMYNHFKRFLRDAQLIVKNKCTDFSALICKMGWETETALGLMLVNLAYENPQFEWYINNMDVGKFYEKEAIMQILLDSESEMKPRAAKCVVNAFERIVGTKFGTVLKFGFVAEDGAMERTKCILNNPRVLLYALYKFNEKCNLGGEFSLSYLYDEDVERDGVSPVRLFGFDVNDWETLKSMLLGLSAAYPDFINATFTNNLQSILLRDKTCEDVLQLFREG